MSQLSRTSLVASFIAATLFLLAATSTYAQDPPVILTVGDPLPGVDINLEQWPGISGKVVTLGLSSDWKLNLGPLAAGKYSLTFKKKPAGACRTCRTPRTFINVDRLSIILEGATEPVAAVLDLRRGVMFNPATFTIEPLGRLTFETKGENAIVGLTAPALPTTVVVNDVTPALLVAGDPIKDSDIGLGQNPGGQAFLGWNLKCPPCMSVSHLSLGPLGAGSYFLRLPRNPATTRYSLIIEGAKYGSVAVVVDLRQNLLFNPATFALEPLGRVTFETTGEDVIVGTVAGIAISQPGIKSY